MIKRLEMLNRKEGPIEDITTDSQKTLIRNNILFYYYSKNKKSIHEFIYKDIIYYFYLSEEEIKSFCGSKINQIFIQKSSVKVFSLYCFLTICLEK